MSNFYAKAINPRTNQEEHCTVLDMGKNTYIKFADGSKHNLKFFPYLTEEIQEMTEQEAINQDGEEVIEYFGDAISPQEAFMYLFVGCIAMIPLIAGIWLCVKLIFKWIGMGV